MTSSRALRVLFALSLGLLLGGCTAVATTATSASSLAPRGADPAAAGTLAGSDVGNDRPRVSFDGLMVRRRVVIAVRPADRADLELVHQQVERAARRLHLSLQTMSASVLDPTLLEDLAPELVLVFPAPTTLAAASALDPTAGQPRGLSGVAAYRISSVLVHDLRFTVASANPAALAAAIAREGILSDALGNYTANARTRELDIAYTGPLLSDDLVASVRGGIGRRAGVAPGAVRLSPRTTTGTGVDLSREPTPAPVPVATGGSRALRRAAPLATRVDPPGRDPWAGSVLALAVTLVLAMLVRRWLRPVPRRTTAPSRAPRGGPSALG